MFTDLGIYDFDPVTKAMRIISLHPKVIIEQVQAATRFQVLENPEMKYTESPSDHEIAILREKIDLAGILRSLR